MKIIQPVPPPHPPHLSIILWGCCFDFNERRSLQTIPSALIFLAELLWSPNFFQFLCFKLFRYFLYFVQASMTQNEVNTEQKRLLKQLRNKFMYTSIRKNIELDSNTCTLFVRKYEKSFTRIHILCHINWDIFGKNNFPINLKQMK